VLNTGLNIEYESSSNHKQSNTGQEHVRLNKMKIRAITEMPENQTYLVDTNFAGTSVTELTTMQYFRIFFNQKIFLKYCLPDQPLLYQENLKQNQYNSV
jgi:hypothetical protein